MREPARGEPGPRLTEQIRSQIQELDAAPLENIGMRVIQVPNVSLFGESNHTLRPRSSEIIERAKTSSHV